MQFKFPELPYSYSALESCIDAETLDIHYNKHHRKYFEKFIEGLDHNNSEAEGSIEEIFANVSAYDSVIRNNGGGYYNHTFFWNCMTPKYRECQGNLKTAIEKKWKSMENFEKKFSEVATNLFASGWVWLIVDEQHQLQIIETHGHDNPLMDICETRGRPILVLDVWEHAYYLRYKNERAGFINKWWSVVNWKFAEEKYGVLFS